MAVDLREDERENDWVDGEQRRWRTGDEDDDDDNDNDDDN
jgi:hypothetical protein